MIDCFEISTDRYRLNWFTYHVRFRDAADYERWLNGTPIQSFAKDRCSRRLVSVPDGRIGKEVRYQNRSEADAVAVATRVLRDRGLGESTPLFVVDQESHRPRKV